MNLPKSLTVAFLTTRQDPKLAWFIQSLIRVCPADIQSLVIQFGQEFPEQLRGISEVHGGRIQFHKHPPKPSIWQGPHKLTKEEWWDKSGYINTAIALCKTEWLALLDDRCVIMPGYFEAIADAMKGEYIVAGKYEKMYNVLVDNGKFLSGDEPIDNGNKIGKDPRATGANSPRRIPGEQLFGCNYAAPVEWLLQVNGSDESTSPTGLEDCVLGMMLSRNNYPIMYDERMSIIEDRTPGVIDSYTKRCDKGPSGTQWDRSHRILAKTHGKLAATHPLNLRELRDKVQAGEPFPVPEEPKTDWFDNQALSEFKEYH